MNPRYAQEPAEALRRVLPEVHSVNVENERVIVRSAGLSLHYFGLLQNAPAPVERLRQWRFALPLQPALATTHTAVRLDVLGVFINGLPIYNQREATAYREQNLWHFDPHAQPDAHGRAPGLLETLLPRPKQHSPLIGFALDGFPIYGPWGWPSSGGQADGSLCPQRSSYRLRHLTERKQLPNGTVLTPDQAGPDVSAEFPLGTFAEDYEYVAGAGELDEFNGRFAYTPEYPQGTYAYFLSFDDAGRFAFPYLLAGAYAGRITADELNEAARDEVGQVRNLSHPLRLRALAKKVGQVRNLSHPLTLSTSHLRAKQNVRLSFQLQTATGQAVRHLAYAHERPLHLLIVSEDLAEFAHIHPELVADNRYEVTHTFAHGGHYRLYADFTPPGALRRVEPFTLKLAGKPRATQPLVLDKEQAKTVNTTRVAFNSTEPLRAGADLELAFTVRDATTNATPDDLEPYLGAWAHCVIIDRPHESFVHAHPLEAAPSGAHTHAALGPPPATMRVAANFPRAGRYKLWLQLQRSGQIVTVPFVIEVAAALPHKSVPVPPDAIAIAVSAAGFTPAELTVKQGRPLKLAFTRRDATNCGGTVVFPALNLRRTLPVNETVLVEFTPKETGALSFTCGMGMLKGALLVQ